ncbi:SCP2 sterol-binding domain-containing protein [Ralstonia pickettii]|jgi:predicted lipid carrier protein YhbT|uniref:ubiquinone anaerobic biosynthesis accessory factor UbiT n=1 Tax=Ralstonia pickettii TaxID=329 RepID=UPI0015FAB033|nr:SCP2 sterol-binding domain-containing protein [Ralstonia pickettii]MBA9883150.1 SCP2 domain-containing protein [Ralstonia pickettii]MBA9892926.1 SCP2 domain-containing protein [Ralstonia pickettii]MBA9925059.1 SCP2 domain-containing protein [Ralstonia pickettii]MBB0093562.1 SCP2 domain-containing protein [Ralstonia pickettii]MBB0102727.1 SCP2 domain-containing protein [Ralstonia pickettii]
MMLRPPATLVRMARRLPTPLTSLPFVLGLDIARRLSWLTPPPELEGRRFAITVEDLGLRACFCCRGGAFHLLSGQVPELELHAGVAEFVALIRGTADADTLFFQRRLKIAGDTELGLIVKNWLDAAARPAWLARWQSR